MPLPTRPYDPNTIEGRLKAAFDKVAFAPEDRGSYGWVDMLELRHVVEVAIPEIAALRRELAEAVATVRAFEESSRTGTIPGELIERAEQLLQRTESMVGPTASNEPTDDAEPPAPLPI